MTSTVPGAKAEWVRPGRTDAFTLRSVGGEDGVFPAEAGRYHLYAPYNCPWSHRTVSFGRTCARGGGAAISLLRVRLSPGPCSAWRAS